MTPKDAAEILRGDGEYELAEFAEARRMGADALELLEWMAEKQLHMAPLSLTQWRVMSTGFSDRSTWGRGKTILDAIRDAIRNARAMEGR